MLRNVTCKTTPVSRFTKSGARVSAVGGAAYRAGENLKARGLGQDGEDKWFRYSNRAVVVREAFIMAPEGAPDFAHDRGELWNRVEEMETHKKARLGREVQLGLAWELSHEDQRELIREFARKEFVERGFVVDVAIHNYGRTLPAMGATEQQQERLREWAAAGVPFLERAEAEGLAGAHVLVIRNREGDATGYKLYQPHAHLRITPRACEDGAFVNDKYASRELNKYETAMAWRYEWPQLQNEYLERAGFDVRVSSTSAEEDEFPIIPRDGTGEDKQLHAIEERREQLSEEARAKHDEAMQAQEIDREFREQHNETLRLAFTEAHHEDADSETASERQQMRLAAWWRNMSQRFNEWRFDFHEKAAEWREHFANQENRLRHLLGWHHDAQKEEQKIQEQVREGQEPEL